MSTLIEFKGVGDIPQQYTNQYFVISSGNPFVDEKTILMKFADVIDVGDVTCDNTVVSMSDVTGNPAQPTRHYFALWTDIGAQSK